MVIIIIILAFIQNINMLPTNNGDFWIDIQQPLDIRYNHLFPFYQVPLQQFSKIWMEMMNFSEEQLNYFDSLADSYFDQELVMDTKIMAKLSAIPFNLLFSMQFMYDLSNFSSTPFGCTSIIVTPLNSDSYIARNLDYGMKDIISQLTRVAHFYNGQTGQIIVETIAIMGQLSITHSIKNNFSSMTLNALTPQFRKQQLYDNLKTNQYYSVTRLMFVSMFKTTSFQDLREILLNATVVSHAFAILLGVNNENAIIHVQDWNAKNNQGIEREQSIPKNEQFIAATNGNYTFGSRERYQVVNERLSKLSNEELRDYQIVINKVLSLPPNKNPLTIVTGILYPTIKNNIYLQFYLEDKK